MVKETKNYLDEQGARVLAEVLGEKIKSMDHLAKEVVIGGEGKTIGDVVTNPKNDVLYIYKTSAEATTGTLYTCVVTNDASGYSSVVWTEISAGGSADLDDYYSKEDLQPISGDTIRSIFNDVMDNLGL